MAMAAHLSDLFLLLPDIAHNLQDALGIGQPGHVSGQGLQLGHLGRDTAGTPQDPPPPTLSPLRAPEQALPAAYRPLPSCEPPQQLPEHSGAAPGSLPAVEKIPAVKTPQVEGSKQSMGMAS